MIEFGNKTAKSIYIDKKEVDSISINNDTVYKKLTEYFYIENTNGVASTITFSNSGTWVEGSNVEELEYSTDKTTWTPIVIKNGNTLNLAANGKVYLRNDNGCLNTQGFRITITCDQTHKVGGNLMSLVNYADIAMNIPQFCFYNLFKNNSNLRFSDELILSDKVSRYCYYNTFRGCNLLISAPVIKSPTAVVGCYYNMFYECRNLNSITTYYSGSGYPSSGGPFDNWLYNTRTTGDFYNLGGGVFLTDSESGIPSGWTVHTSL